ncbi:MAG: carbohydrate kinase [Synechococcales bacterium]|nr:carbohydrate kinase [Synechococcales bacterium]
MVQVVCLGEILFDCIADQLGKPLEQVESWTAYPGGAPANVACALQKLGRSAAFVGCVGNDDRGKALITLLREIGVNTTGVQVNFFAPTRTVLVTRTLTGDRHFAAFGDQHCTQAFADTQLQPEDLPIDLFAQADFLVTGTLGLASPQTATAIAQAVDLIKHYGGEVVVDLNWRPVFWDDPSFAPALIRELLAKADWLKLTDEEANWLFHTTDLQEIAAEFPQLKAILLTAGEQGCTYWIPAVAQQTPLPHTAAFAVTPEDTTGAGDGFLAGFLHQLCRQGTDVIQHPSQFHEMITYASAVGALTTLRPGAIAAQPNAQEVEAFLHLQERIHTDLIHTDLTQNYGARN